MDEEVEEIEEPKGEEKLNYFISKLKEKPWQVTTFVLGLACIILLFLALKPGVTGNAIKGEDAGEKLTSYLNSMVGGGVEYIDYEDLGNIYQINVKYKEDEIPVYITKDGSYFVQGISPLTAQAIQEPQTVEQQEVPKSDNPRVDLFVMTHCPYGTQAEKGFIPVLELLGGEINGKIRFVHYFMHGDEEEQETYRQLCIREEQSNKFIDYLSCFLEDGDSNRCISKIGIDKAELDSCVSGKAKDYYDEDSSLSQEHGVRGSPTLVINGQIVSSSRSPQAFFDTICSAFNTESSTCQESLSSETPSPGFGYGTSSGSSAGQC